MIVRNENHYKTVCRFCGKTVRFYSGYCFFATTAFGEDAPGDMVLRRFHDVLLRTTAFGRG